MQVAETCSCNRVSIALISANQIHPTAKRPTLSNKSPPKYIGRTSVAQPTGKCRHAQDFTFLTACLEPACTWGLTFSIMPFVTWSAFSECRVPRWCCALTRLPENRGPQVRRSVGLLGIPAPKHPALEDGCLCTLGEGKACPRQPSGLVFHASC